MFFRLFRILLVSFSLAAATTLATSPMTANEAEAAKSKGKKKKSGKRLSANRYYTMRPFTLPLMQNGQVMEQFTIVIAMELGYEDARSDVHRMIPRFRNEMYKTLYSLVTFRRRGSALPEIEIFKKRLLKVAQRVSSKRMIKNLLIQQAFKRDIR
tara:strand:+ start:8776 stop:9240 length:465 start_codon:yes stop_codon:yes gene_type:complete